MKNARRGERRAAAARVDVAGEASTTSTASSVAPSGDDQAVAQAAEEVGPAAPQRAVVLERRLEQQARRQAKMSRCRLEASDSTISTIGSRATSSDASRRAPMRRSDARARDLRERLIALANISPVEPRAGRRARAASEASTIIQPVAAASAELVVAEGLRGRGRRPAPRSSAPGRPGQQPDLGEEAEGEDVAEQQRHQDRRHQQRQGDAAELLPARWRRRCAPPRRARSATRAAPRRG